jgi:[ribosomal protein S5]-alanine N-acetyltransferase
MVPEGETQRLLLRPIALGDAAQVQEIFPHWEVVRYLDTRVPWPYPADGARQFIEHVVLPAVARGDAWNWTLRLKIDPERIVGNLELRRGTDDHRGFWIGLPWQHQGLMTEACVWANDFWFETLGCPLLRVSKAVENRASRRISEKLGMRLVGIREKQYVCGCLPSAIWEMTADEWRAWKRQGAREHGSEGATRK